jgi:hypothetical protein
LGGGLRVELADRVEAPTSVPNEVVQFARGPRFAEVAARVAAGSGQPEAAVRDKLLTLLVGTASVCGRFDDLVGHRLLDAVLLSS